MSRNNGHDERVLRSAEWFGTRDLEGFLHRSGLKAQGWSEEIFADRPVIGIANSWSEATHCNAHLRDLAGHVKRGVLAAGGFPLEFPTISLGEFFLSPTSHVLPQSHVNGRRGDDSRAAHRRRGAVVRLRQDHAGHAHGRGVGRSAGHPADGRSATQRQLAG